MGNILNVWSSSLSILELRRKLWTHTHLGYGERTGLFPPVFKVPLSYLDIANRRHVFGKMGQFSSLLIPTKTNFPSSLSGSLRNLWVYKIFLDTGSVCLSHPAPGNKQASWPLKLTTKLKQKIIPELPFSMLYLFYSLHKASPLNIIARLAYLLLSWWRQPRFTFFLLI